MMILNILCFVICVVSVFCRPETILNSRIVGGTDAPPAQYPYQASLRTPANSHFCGGSIISNRWILTAAHCVYGKTPNSMMAVVGTNYLNSGGTAYGIAFIQSHEGYDPQNNQNDIAVLGVNGVITILPTIKVNISGIISVKPTVATIGLASENTPGGTPAVLSGWGLTSYPSNQLPNNLKHIGLTTITVVQCQSSLPGYPVFNTHICTYDGVGYGACQGDSGGPLVNLANQQIGVTSWGIPCAKGSPDIFTAVASYRSWIRQITGI